jgi:hypothetical protein
MGHSQFAEGCGLEFPPVLNFEEFLCGEENALEKAAHSSWDRDSE